MSETNEFFLNLKNSRKFIFPIVLTIFLAGLFTAMVFFAYGEDSSQNIAPVNGTNDFQNDPAGATATALTNALVYVVIALIGGFFLVFLIRMGKIRLLELLFASMMGFATFIFGLYVLVTVPLIIFNMFPQLIDLVSLNVAIFIVNEGMLLLSIGFGVLSFLVLGLQRFKSQKIHNALMILFGSMMGAVFGVNFPTFSLFFVLIALALYDIYAVFWGPIKQMFAEPDQNKVNVEQFSYADSSMTIEKEREDDNESTQHYSIDQTTFPGVREKKITEETQKDPIKPDHRLKLTKSTKTEEMGLPFSIPVYYTPEISIGLGDFVFFSVLIGKSVFEGLRSQNLWLFLLPFLGILFGSYYTFRLLEQREILPALPIPIIFGTVGFIFALIFGFIPQLFIEFLAIFIF